MSEISIDQLHPHPDTPFGIRDDPSMMELVESVKQFGVLVPAIARPREDGSYELIAGHRRQKACELAGLDSMPVIVMNLDDNDAIIQMVDSNIQRENTMTASTESTKSTMPCELLLFYSTFSSTHCSPMPGALTLIWIFPALSPARITASALP